MVFGTQLATIGQNVFNDCSSLTTVVFPLTSTASAVYNSFIVTSKSTCRYKPPIATYVNFGMAKCACMYPPDVNGLVTIPSSWTTIPDNAFDGCTGLKSVSLPSSLTSVGKSAFTSSGLLTVFIPDAVTVIKESAFDGCASLTSVVFGGGSQLTTIN